MCQDRRKLIFGGGQGESKKIWLKQSPKKRNLNQNINDSKSHIWIFHIFIFQSHIWNFFFENIISVSGIQLFHIRPHVSLDIVTIFYYYLNFLAESLKANKNQRKSSLILQYSFVHKTWLILWNSTHSTLKIICSCNKARNLSHFTNFSAKIFLFGVRKNICAASFLDAQELHSWSTLKANAWKCLFQRLSKILSGWGRG